MDDHSSYSVFIDARASSGQQLLDNPEPAMDALMDLLEDHDGIVGANALSWSAAVSVDAFDPVNAMVRATNMVTRYAEKAGLPPWPVVDVRVVRADVLDEENSKPNIPDLVSSPEVADILGVNRQRVHQLAHENRAFPKPLYQLAAGWLWDRAAIKQFADDWERKPGRPRQPARH